jgi:hypothetical protein
VRSLLDARLANALLAKVATREGESCGGWQATVGTAGTVGTVGTVGYGKARKNGDDPSITKFSCVGTWRSLHVLGATGLARRCNQQGLPDDCRQLQVLRALRDTHLLASIDGLELVERYYAMAPEIAACLTQ